MPKKTSNKHVKYIISVFYGIIGGNIIVIPFVNAKCPIAVKNNMAHIPILADK